ncbi:unnamed protein product [Alopecurus aequalis]
MYMRRHAVAIAVTGLLISLTPHAAGMPWEICINNTGNYTANSTYEHNLRRVAAALPGNVSTSPDFFATAATGTAPERVHAVGVCRGDLQDAAACLACITAGFTDAQEQCRYSRGVAIFYDECLLGFSDRDLLVSPTNSDDEQVIVYNAQNITSDLVDQYDTLVYELLNSMSEYVATVNSTRKFVTGTIAFAATFPHIYGIAWCTPDLTPGQCRHCLAAVIAELTDQQLLVDNTMGVRITGLRCSVRYEVYPFYAGPSMVHLPETTGNKSTTTSTTPIADGKSNENTKSNTTGKILAIVVPTVAAMALCSAVCLCCWRRMTKSKKSLSYASQMEDLESIESLVIDLTTLRIATSNFAENNKLGEGGFGAVYKGSLPDGQEVAVKRLSQSSQQGIGELKNELALIVKLQHKNLVRLVGVCLQDEEKLLVYEYLPNTSLDTFLFDSEKRKEIGWGKRFTIINGIARGLQYLHEDSLLKIVHRDLKASNVLLDENMDPKISDFGLARLFGGNQLQDTTVRVVGTYGYMAPEYALRGQYSMKSDTYSFGVLILEILTGRRNSDCYTSEQSVDLPGLIWEHWTTETTMEIIDPYLRSESSCDEILRCIHIGLSCVQESPMDRPTMSRINAMLDSNSTPSQAPSKPAFYIEMSGNSSGMYSRNEVSITDIKPR